MHKGLIIFLMFSAVCTGFAQEGADWYQGKPIREIVFEGLRHVKLSELEGVTAPYIGRPFNDETFLELQGRLYALEYFDMITPGAVPADPQGNAVILRFTVTERPVVSRINFVGNRGLRRAELGGIVTVKVNDVVNQITLRADELALINKYLEKGYPDISVRAETQASGESSIIVNFFIEEGEQITIDAFYFEGNTIFSSRTLKGQLSLKAKGAFADGAFQEAKLIADQAAIAQYYRNRGYIDADVIDVVQNVQKDKKGANRLSLTFRISEGQRYDFSGITFEGNQIFTNEQLSALVRSKIADTANAERIEADIQKVVDLYAENGYIFNSITPEEVKDSDAGTIGYKLVIVERGRAHIERILVRGNEKTKDHVILREIPVETGDIFSKARVMNGMRNLYNLQYFSDVVVETPPGSAESLMDLIFDVEEQPTTDVQFGLTFSGSSDPDTFPISGLLKWTDRNFLGYGNQVGASVSASPDTQSVSLEYTQRWILGLPLSGGFDFTFQHAKRKAAMDNIPETFSDEDFENENMFPFPDGFNSYDEYLYSGKLPPNAYLMDYHQYSLSLGFSTGYTWSTFLGNLGVGGGIRAGMVFNKYDDELFRPFDPVLRQNNNRWTPTNSIWASVSLDQRDVYYDPSRGYYGIQRFGVYGILPVEREHYFRTDTDVEYFHTLLNIPITDKYAFRAVFGIHSGVSFILPQPNYGVKKFIEDASKLAVDGMFVGRGWTDERSNTGLALWENWAEIRIPLVPGMLALDWFFDAAAVTPKAGDLFTKLRVEDMRFSFGAGLRFTIPQFPFRFIFAKRFRVEEDGVLRLQRGAIWNSSRERSGMDFVISFALSTY